MTELTGSARTVWARVVELRELAVRRDQATIHPRYSGWDRASVRPHDRSAAVASVLGDAPAIVSYSLEPQVVEVFEERVGVAHYSFRAEVLPTAGPPRWVTGPWTEVYLFSEVAWLLIAVHGGADEGPEAAHEGHSSGTA